MRVALWLLLAGCSSSPSSKGVLGENGRLHFVDLSGSAPPTLHLMPTALEIVKIEERESLPPLAPTSADPTVCSVESWSLSSTFERAFEIQALSLGACSIFFNDSDGAYERLTFDVALPNRLQLLNRDDQKSEWMIAQEMSLGLPMRVKDVRVRPFDDQDHELVPSDDFVFSIEDTTIAGFVSPDGTLKQTVTNSSWPVQSVAPGTTNLLVRRSSLEARLPIVVR